LRRGISEEDPAGREKCSRKKRSERNTVGSSSEPKDCRNGEGLQRRKGQKLRGKTTRKEGNYRNASATGLDYAREKSKEVWKKRIKKNEKGGGPAGL